MNTHPTHRTYTSLEAAYDHFNRDLFSGQLPACLITMQRHKGAYGYFSGARFAATDNPQEVTDEIALNPAHFASRPTAGTLSTLAHEMAHLWQHHFGKPSRTGYHNKEWAGRMKGRGAHPERHRRARRQGNRAEGEPLHRRRRRVRAGLRCAHEPGVRPALR